MLTDCDRVYMFDITRFKNGDVLYVNESSMTLTKNGVITHMTTCITCQCGILSDIAYLEELDGTRP